MEDHNGKKIQVLIQNKRTSQRAVAEGINVPESTLSRWIGMKKPPHKAIEKICKYLNESLSRFYASPNDDFIQVNSIEKSILQEFRSLPEERQLKVISIVKELKDF